MYFHNKRHILSNMHDQLMKLVQLMKYKTTQSFSMLLTNEVIGSEINVTADHLRGLDAFGVDTSLFNELEDSFSFLQVHQFAQYSFATFIHGGNTVNGFSHLICMVLKRQVSMNHLVKARLNSFKMILMELQGVQ